MAGLLPVVLLAGSSILLASHEVTRQVDDRVWATAATSAVVVGQQTADLATLVQSYADGPSLSRELAAGSADGAQITSMLSRLTAAAGVGSSTFISDLAGTTLFRNPPAPGVVGHNFAYRDWYKGLRATGRSYVSAATPSVLAGHPLVVAVVNYIRGPDGRPAAILGATYNLASVEAFSHSVAKVDGITLTVTDRAGTVLSAGGLHGVVSAAVDAPVRDARAGRSGLLRYTPVLPGRGHGPREVAAYTSVPATGWTVTASIPTHVAFAGLVRLRDTVLVITAVLVLIMLAGAATLARNDRRRRRSDQRSRRQDRQLARMLESTEDAFVSIDASGAVTAWSGRAAELFGWKPDEVLGRGLAETIIPQAQRDAHRAGVSNYRPETLSAVVGKRVELSALHRDGHEIPVEVSVWANDDGEGFGAFVHNITERVRTRVELEEARDKALQASHMKSEFLANMSHEIRTPMNGVIGMSTLLLNTNLNFEQRDFAQTVSSSAEALLTVINDILDFSKIEAGKLTIETVPFDLGTVVEESAVLLAARAQQTGVELTCLVDPALPANLEGDPGRLRQVLLNLLGNAVKFTSQGEVNLTARLAGTGSDGVVMVALAVRDTGIGMTPATLELLFEKFTQADTSTTRRYGGTGLGLAIARQLVELMGGTLTATSELGTGSTFTANIPFQTGDHPTVPIGPADLNGVHALIVDDNTTNQQVLQAMIEAWGGTALTADGADTAMLLLGHAADTTDPVDVILLDLNVPDIDGHSLARAVRADPRLAHIPMIMLTSSLPRQPPAGVEPNGIVAVLTKPVRAARLRAALNIALPANSPPATLPTQTHPTDDRSVAAPSPARAEPAPAGRTAAIATTLLVVEDNLINQKVAAAILSRHGYSVETAINGIEALQQMDGRRYGAVLMDCQMPVMDGYEATRLLRAREGANRYTPIIALTASALTGDRQRCLDAGMDDYLTKPLQMDDLMAALQRWSTPTALAT